jgi:MFS family permease
MALEPGPPESMSRAAASSKPQPTAAVRWSVLLFVSLAMFGNYYIYDSIAPVARILSEQLGFTDTQIGILNAIYSFPNIIMVLIGGIIVDRYGTRTATLVFTAICMLGAVLTVASSSFYMMALARLIFGLGAESMIVAVTAALGHWFKGRQLGLAFGINLSIARAGSYAADLSPTWAKGAYDSGWRAPLLLAACFGLISLAAAAIYWFVERSAESRFNLLRPTPSDKIVWSDLWRFDHSYWYIVGLCVTFYSVIFPFRSTFSIKYFQEAHGLSLERAGEINGDVFLAAIFATPLFGFLVDRVGKRSLFMALGSLALFPVFLILAYTSWDLWISTAMIGLAFSLVPAVMWPSVPYLVEERRLGTAYGLMTMLQNIGLTVCNLGAGMLNDFSRASAEHPSGYLPMLWMFATLSLAGLVFSVALRRREVGPEGHGLETVRAHEF